MMILGLSASSEYPAAMNTAEPDPGTHRFTMLKHVSRRCVTGKRDQAGSI